MLHFQARFGYLGHLCLQNSQALEWVKQPGSNTDLSWRNTYCIDFRKWHCIVILLECPKYRHPIRACGKNHRPNTCPLQLVVDYLASISKVSKAQLYSLWMFMDLWHSCRWLCKTSMHSKSQADLSQLIVMSRMIPPKLCGISQPWTHRVFCPMPGGPGPCRLVSLGRMWQAASRLIHDLRQYWEFTWI